MRALQALVLLALASPPTLAQEQEGPVVPPLGGDQATDAVEELKRLFLEVERTLERIDDELADAGAGMTELAEVEDGGLDDLLRQTMRRSAEAQAKIDEILRIASQMSQSQGGGSSQQQSDQQNPGESPLDQQQNGSPSQRENTPEAPPPGQEQQEQGQDEQGEQQDEQPSESEDGEKPDSNEESTQSGENRDGQVQPDEVGDAVPHGDEKDRWGVLPERVQQVFRNQGRDDLPVRYRDWIDTYYRRLNDSGR